MAFVLLTPVGTHGNRDVHVEKYDTCVKDKDALCVIILIHVFGKPGVSVQQ